MSKSNAPPSVPLKSEPPSTARYMVLASLWLAATIAYMGRNCLGVAASDVSVELEFSTTDMGKVMSAFFWGYALAQIPCGWLGHVWGVRQGLAVFAICWSFACAALGASMGFGSLVLFQVVFGIAQAGIFPCSAAAIINWQPIARRAFASGALGSFMSIGAAVGAALTGLALSGIEWPFISIAPISWRWVFVLFALPSVLWAIGFYVWFRDRPEEHWAVNQAELRLIQGDRDVGKPAKPDHKTPIPWLAVITSFDMWMIFGQQFFRAAGYIFFATWFPTYLKETRGVSTVESGFLTALPFLAVVAGGAVGGVVVDFIWHRTASRRLSRQLVAVVSMLGCALFIAIAYFVHHPLLAVFLISLGTFNAALAGSCGYTVTMEKAGEHVAPIFGAMNMCGNLGAAACPLVVGWMVHQLGQWDLVLILFVGIYIAAAVCWALLDPNGTLSR